MASPERVSPTVREPVRFLVFSLASAHPAIDRVE